MGSTRAGWRDERLRSCEPSPTQPARFSLKSRYQRRMAGSTASSGLRPEAMKGVS